MFCMKTDQSIYFFQEVLYAHRCPVEEANYKKWKVPAVDLAISCLNKSLTVPFEHIPVFKDLMDKSLEACLKASFALSSLAMQP